MLRIPMSSKSRNRRSARTALAGFVLLGVMTSGCDDPADERVPRMRSIRLYAFEARRAEHHSDQALGLCPSCLLLEDVVAVTFARARPVPHAFYERDNHFAVATLDDGRTVRLAVSAYGAMFRFLDSQRVYRLEGEARAALDPHLDRAYREMRNWPK